MTLPGAIARGNACLDDGDLAGAQRAVAEALAAQPSDPSAQYLNARLKRLRGDPEGAGAALDAALAIDDDHIPSLIESALVARDLRDFDKAFDALSAVLYHEPSNARAQLEMGRLYRMQGAMHEALACQRSAVEADPALVDAWSEIGWILTKRNDFTGALEAYEKALALDPENLMAHHNLGFILGKLERYERALELLEDLCNRTPASHTGARLNLALALSAHGETRRAAQIYDRILAAEPNHVSARWNRAHFLLAGHDFEAGWRDYEWRFLTDSIGAPRLIPHRRWRGEPLEGARLLVTAEQGLGDQIMFASCLPDVIARAASVTVECNARLEVLFRRSFPGVRVIGSGQEHEPKWLKDAGEFDFHAALGSLPAYLRTRKDDFPEHRGYLSADSVKVARWRERLDALGPGLKVGLSWRGGTHATRKRLRTIELPDLQALCATPGCRFVSLQYGDCATEIDAFRSASGIALAHWQEAIDDYDETAALCSALDLTVSVCTSVIHLNGALGRRVWILVPSAPEWRYGFAGERMPWYPSARLYRQEDRSAWTPILERIRSDLAALASGPN